MLARHNSDIEADLKYTAAIKVFRFIDDFLVIYRVSQKRQVSGVNGIKTVFAQNRTDFALAKELPIKDELQVFVLRFLWNAKHMC